MPLQTLLTNPSPVVPRARTILSRFTNPLAKHTRNIADFTIEPQDPWRSYGPGDVVKGDVVLTVAKGLDITHIVVALHGFAKVYKHSVVPGEGLPSADTLVNGKGNSGFEYHGNGLASLFQDEIVLCRSGFLKKQIYKFGFELEFPDQSLPSSIDFERGTISYIISATLTRPTTIMPTVSRYKRVTFQDLVDVEHVAAAKPHIVSLEPVSRRGKAKRVRRNPLQALQDKSGITLLTRSNTDASVTSRATDAKPQPPPSPAPTENTTASSVSESTPSIPLVDRGPLVDGISPRASLSPSSTASLTSGTIIASTEITRPGALPGDSVPIRVSVSHNKPNLRGVVIATLYRQGRIDMHPAIPLGRGTKGHRPEYEEIYPTSRTGLGGLSLAQSSPSSLFRKDLAQSSTMMVIDPQTLTAEVKTSVRVPDDAFPSITNVPGGMISFRYHIEVVIDLCGKLGETRFLPRLTSTEPTFSRVADNGNQVSSDWGNSILDTAQLRRTKSVVDATFLLTVGTRDSGRQARRPREERQTTPLVGCLAPPDSLPENRRRGAGGDAFENGHEHAYDHTGEDYHGFHRYDGHPDQIADQPPSAQFVPPPPPAEEHVDEKTRLQREAELLLPSRPPLDAETLAAQADFAPSAPFLPSQSDLNCLMALQARPISCSAPPVRSLRSIDPTVLEAGPWQPSNPDVGAAYNPSEDKQELERKRLMALVSAPAVDEEDGPSSSAGQVHIPSAPVLDDDQEYNAQTLNHQRRGSDGLPQYQR